MRQLLVAISTIVIGSAIALRAAAPPQAPVSASLAVAEQNRLVQQYCAPCHTDKAPSGGLSLQHFDALTAAPSLAAMMVSKIANGTPLDTVRASAATADAASIMHTQMTGGAMHAAGIALPPQDTIDAFARALAARAERASEWSTEQRGPITFASMAREVPSRSNTASMYRLIASCNADTRVAELQLTWAPQPAQGKLTLNADQATEFTFGIDGSEASFSLFNSPNAASAAPFWPASVLTATGLFGDHSVEFPFKDLPAATRRALNACITEGW